MNIAMQSIAAPQRPAPSFPPVIRPALARRPQFEAVWARHADEVRAAQALRWSVFAGEIGARLHPPAGTPPGLDVDVFDAYCEHLLVRTLPQDDGPAQVVGTYRVLTPAAARLMGGLYCETQFDLVRLRQLRPRMAELGRSCTHPQWRSGGVILSLWASLGQFLHRSGLDCVIGSASISMRDGGRLASQLWHGLRQTHLVDAGSQVRPRRPLDLLPADDRQSVEAPPLIKGYLRCGGRVLGPPAWDADFRTADLPMMLRMADLPEAYRSRFIRA